MCNSTGHTGGKFGLKIILVISIKTIETCFNGYSRHTYRLQGYEAVGFSNYGAPNVPVLQAWASSALMPQLHSII